MGVCDSTETPIETSLDNHIELAPPASPLAKRKKALDEILTTCREEERHWVEKINGFEYDEKTKECFYIISYWSRKYIEQSSVLHVLLPAFTTTIALQIMIPYYEAETGLFDHSPRKQFDAKKKWAHARLKWIRRRIKLVEAIKNELIKYQYDWEENAELKKYWRCQLCRHCKIFELYIRQKHDTFWNYSNEISKFDKDHAYNIVIYCKTQGAPQKHRLYVDYNLRKYEVLKQYKIHRCQLCNDNHKVSDEKKHRICDQCCHPLEKHEQIWCRHEDEFDGSEVVENMQYNTITLKLK